MQQLPNQDDWKKLRRMIQCLHERSSLWLTLETNESQMLGYHDDMRNKSGGTISLDKEVSYVSFIIHRSNTCSSTATPLVAADEFTSQVLWTRYLLEGQGYDSKVNVMYQDRQSPIPLEMKIAESKRKCQRTTTIRALSPKKLVLMNWRYILALRWT